MMKKVKKIRVVVGSKRLLLGGLILFMGVFLMSFTSATLTDGLTDWWKFDEGSGTSAGNFYNGANNISLGNTDNTNWISGHSGNAINLSTNEYGNASYFLPLQEYHNFTISTWIKVYDFTTQKTIFDNRANKSFFLEVNNGDVRYWTTGTGYVTIGSLTSVDAWEYVALVFNGTGFTGYINGTQTHVGNAVVVNSSGIANRIGTQVGTGAYMNGAIDELRVWNRT